MLTRIYGTAFHSQADLDRHQELLELAREHDHRRLGPELDLFRLREEAPGMPFWLPNGTVLWRLVEREVREQLVKRGYAEIKTPHVADSGAPGAGGAAWSDIRIGVIGSGRSKTARANRAPRRRSRAGILVGTLGLCQGRRNRDRTSRRAAAN